MILGALGLLAAAFWLGAGPGDRNDHLLISEAVATPLETGGALALMRIENRGKPDRLIAAASSVVEAALYTPEAAEGPPVPTGESFLAQDGAHIRLSAPRETFVDGALIPLTLTFAEAGEVAAKVRLADPAVQGKAQEVGLFGLGDICVVGDGEPAPKIALSVSPDGAGWRVRIEAEDFAFSKDFVDLYHVPGMGHGHIYVGGMKIGRLYAPEAYIGALPEGQHEIRVTLNTNDHRAYVVDGAPASASTTITIE
ncbi:MAG: hypothetical protein ACR2RA_10935 [Geminicoccaceae bacterium]